MATSTAEVAACWRKRRRTTHSVPLALAGCTLRNGSRHLYTLPRVSTFSRTRCLLWTTCFMPADADGWSSFTVATSSYYHAKSLPTPNRLSVAARNSSLSGVRGLLHASLSSAYHDWALCRRRAIFVLLEAKSRPYSPCFSCFSWFFVCGFVVLVVLLVCGCF